MFTGLIEEIGSVKALSNNKISIFCKRILEDSKIGDSISINGVCLSITEIYSDYLSFHVSPTTIELSRFKTGDIRAGEKVNLERALIPRDRLGGHIVSGHIDGKARIISIKKKGSDSYFEFLYPKELKNLIASKGSIAIDGISLTVSNIASASFVTTIIPHTLQSTNLGQKRVGDFVHIEVDIFARYIYHIIKNRRI